MGAPQFIAAVMLVLMVIGNVVFIGMVVRPAWKAHRQGFRGMGRIAAQQSVSFIINIVGALGWALLLNWGGFWG